MIQDKAIVTLELQSELVCNLSNGAISSDLEWPLTHISGRAIIWRNISETLYETETYRVGQIKHGPAYNFAYNNWAHI